MKSYMPDTLRSQAILLVGAGLFLFYIFSLFLYVILSVSTATLEREEQIVDRIVTIIRLIDHASPLDRPYLAHDLSGSKFQVSIDDRPLSIASLNNNGVMVSELIIEMLVPASHLIKADYISNSAIEWSETLVQERQVASQHVASLFRIHETLLVSVDLPDDNWLNFRVSGSAWDHVFSLAAIPSLALILGTILLAGWVVTKPLNSISRLARASKDLATNIQIALPISEDGPKEIREAARAFNHMQSQIQHLLEARTEMLGAISHDFRTPLTRLRLRVEELPSEDQRNKAIRDVEEMETMIKLTLAFARDEATESYVPIDVGAMVSEITGDPNISKDKISIKHITSARVTGQPVGLRRVFTNIFENAVFYSQRVNVELRQQGKEVIVEIDDDGPGIDEALRHRVFIPFYRSEPSRNRETGGVGLGLSIAKSIVHANGGTIELFDSPMGGLRVRIIFPQSLNHKNSHDEF